MVGPNPGHGFNMATIPTFEETIANLPYDAMQATRQLSNPSGIALLGWMCKKKNEETVLDVTCIYVVLS